MTVVDSLWWKSRRVPDVRVRPRDLHAGLLPAVAAFLLAGQVALRPLEFLLRAAQEPRRGDLGPVIEHREMAQAEVDAALAAGLRQRVTADLHDERGEEPPGRILDHALASACCCPGVGYRR